MPSPPPAPPFTWIKGDPGVTCWDTCVAVGGVDVLRADPSVRCYDAAWRSLAVLGGLGTAVYACGFPLLCYLLTRAAHRKAATTDVAGREASLGRESVDVGEDGGRRSVQRVRLLVRSYDARFWYWESLEVLRKRAPPVREGRWPGRLAPAPRRAFLACDVRAVGSF